MKATKISAATLGVTFGTLLLVMTSQRSSAQNASEGENQPAASNSLEEIVVTAQKRKENLQDVPISVSVIGSALLDSEQVTGVADLARISPSLNYQAGGVYPGNTSFSLRGIGAYAPQPGFQPSIGVVIDDVPLARQGEFDSGLNDIESVQVLNGPQGTLFGTSTIGGAIIITTKEPTKTFGGYAEASATDDGEYIERLTLSGPLSDDVRARVTVYNRDLQSYINNLYPGVPNSGGQKETGGRVKFDIDLTDNLNLRISADHTKTITHPIDQVTTADTTQYLTALGNGNPVLGQQIVDNNWLINTNGLNAEFLNDWGTSAVLTWNFDHSFTLKSITSYRNYNLDTYGLGAGISPATIADPQGLPYVVLTRSNVSFDSISGPAFNNNLDYITEELRLEHSGSLINWLIGGFYDHYDELLYGELPLVLAPAYNAVFDQPRRAAVTLRSEAVFADATWHVTDVVDIFGGIRGTHESSGNDYVENTYDSPEFTVYNGGFAVYSPGVQPLASTSFYAKTSDNEWSGRFGAKWSITSDVNVYASASRGFTGTSDNMSMVATANNAFLSPSIATSYEVGLKSMLLDRRLILNTALFKTKVSNLQADEGLNTFQGVQEVEFNAGGLKVKGWEQSITALVGERLIFSGNLSLLDSKLSGTLLQSCYRDQTFAEGCSVNVGGGSFEQDVDGKQGIDAPRLKYNLNGRYNLPLPSMPFNAYATSSYTWQSSNQYSLTYDPIATVERSFGLLDFSAGIVAKDNRYEVSLFGKNVLNQVFALQRDAPTPGLGRAEAYFSRDARAYWGVKARVNF
jgi:iron complex outermembrane recepter protein